MFHVITALTTYTTRNTTGQKTCHYEVNQNYNICNKVLPASIETENKTKWLQVRTNNHHQRNKVKTLISLQFTT